MISPFKEVEFKTESFVQEPGKAGVMLTVEDVSKKFCRSLKRSLFYGAFDILAEMIGRERSNTLRKGEFWALRGISFELRRGQALGLIGANGAGKSTLLRIISGLIKPDTGLIKITGRVAPLIALGAGFNPVLTGRENIYVNMSVLGLSKNEIDLTFQNVVDFAEIGEALDAPLQTYSSGMAARLGFACAVHTDPDILLIDEVLAVGDIKFRMKCYRKLSELREEGVAFILVSHSPQSILSVCDSAIYFSKGRLVASGDVNSTMARYEKDLYSNLDGMTTAQSTLFLPERPQSESLGLDIVSVFFRDEQGKVLDNPVSGLPTSFCVKCKAYKIIDNVNLNLLVREDFGDQDIILRLCTLDDKETLCVTPGEQELQIQMPYLGLKPNVYNMKLSISQSSIYLLDAVESFRFKVEGPENFRQSSFYQPRTWQVMNGVSKSGDTKLHEKVSQ